MQVQHAPYMSFVSLLKGLDLFIDRLKIARCHMLGEGFGGYVVQCYAQHRPAKVASIVLCNSYCDMQHFVDSSPFTGFLSWMPDLLMKRFLVSDLRYKGPDRDQLLAYKFVSYYAKKYDTDDLCSRLTLQYIQGPLKPKDFPVPDEVITVIDTADPVAFPDRIRLEVHKFYPAAKEVTLARGGTFPFLSVPVEFANAVDAHLQANSKNLLFTTDVAPSPDSSASIAVVGSSALPSSSYAPQSSPTQTSGPQHPSNHTHSSSAAHHTHTHHSHHHKQNTPSASAATSSNGTIASKATTPPQEVANSKKTAASASNAAGEDGLESSSVSSSASSSSSSSEA